MVQPKYDYEKQVKSDIEDYIKETFTDDDLSAMTPSQLMEELVDVDSITGRQSGSYFCNRSSAEDALHGNFDLFIEAISSYEDKSVSELKNMSPELADVEIRIYLMSKIVQTDYADKLAAE